MFTTHGVAQLFKKIVADALGIKRRSSDDDLMRALIDQVFCAIQRADSSADAASRAGRKEPDDGIVRTASNGCVEIDDLKLRKRLEALEHFLGGSALQRLFAAPDQLDHLAIHKVDTGKNHTGGLTGMSCWSRNCFKSATV